MSTKVFVGRLKCLDAGQILITVSIWAVLLVVAPLVVEALPFRPARMALAHVDLRTHRAAVA